MKKNILVVMLACATMQLGAMQGEVPLSIGFMRASREYFAQGLSSADWHDVMGFKKKQRDAIAERLKQYLIIAREIDYPLTYVVDHATGKSLYDFAIDNRDYDLAQLIRNNALQEGVGSTDLAIAISYGNASDVKKLIKEGADIYTVNKLKRSALMEAVTFDFRDRDRQLYLRTWIVKMILEKVTELTANDKKTIKTWLLVNQRLKQEGRVHLPKDPRTIVAQIIYESFPALLRERIVQVGGLEALDQAKKDNFLSAVQLLEQYLDPKFLEERVRNQLPQMSGFFK